MFVNYMLNLLFNMRHNNNRRNLKIHNNPRLLNQSKR